MRVRISLNKSIYENAALYYEEAKKIRKKIEGLKKAIEETRKKLKEVKKKEKVIKIKRERQWYEKFHWFFTSEGKLVIGGRDAQQNEIIVSKYMDEGDLFFHADVQGGSVVVLKQGTEASEQEFLEAAQFAACFSKAWVAGYSSVHVFSAKKSQLSKYSTGEYVPKGGFVIKGEKTWFKNIPLRLVLFKENDQLIIMPKSSKKKVDNVVEVLPGRIEKGDAVKKLSRFFNVHSDDVAMLLPAGRLKLIFPTIH